ncbi:hypothetical protein D3C87_1930040 [compost metagenome]
MLIAIVKAMTIIMLRRTTTMPLRRLAAKLTGPMRLWNVCLSPPPPPPPPPPSVGTPLLPPPSRTVGRRSFSFSGPVSLSIVCGRGRPGRLFKSSAGSLSLPRRAVVSC